MRDGAEILIDQPMSLRGQKFLRAMAEAAGSVVTPRYVGKHRLLMMYGPGAPRKLPLLHRHVKAGGRVITWDLGYWDRERGMRLAIDGLHPTPAQLAMAGDAPARRLFDLREDADPAGPIMLVGLGPKSCYAYGLGRNEWEKRTLADLRQRFPGRKIIWRPKGHRPDPLGNLEVSHGNAIEHALQGCSLVVCRHSNVAIDACVAGVPVECEAGAAAALYAGNPAPSRDERADFLRRLSWWEWARNEAAQAWAWINKVTA